MPAASRSNSRAIRSRRPASGRPRRSTATSPISAWSRCCTAIRSTAWCSPPAATRPRRPASWRRRRVNIPAIVLSGGPMLNGWWKGERAGSGTVVWKAREELAAGKIDYQEFLDIVAVVGAVGRPLQHHGHRLDHECAGRSARHVAAGLRRDPGAVPRARPDRLRDRPCARSRSCTRTCKPSDILTREAFENAIVANSAIGGSTNAPIHINAIARHIGVEAHDRGLGDDRLRRAAAGQHAAGRQISRRGILPRRRPAGGDARTAQGRASVHADALHHQRQDAWARTSRKAEVADADVIRPYDKPMKKQAGFKVLNGNLFDSAIMKTSVISDEFRERYLSNPERPERVRGPRRGVRRAGGLPPPHRRSVAQDRRTTPCCSCAASARSAIRARPRS